MVVIFQNLIFAVQSLDVDPSLTPVALAVSENDHVEIVLLFTISVLGHRHQPHQSVSNWLNRGVNSYSISSLIPGLGGSNSDIQH